MKNNDKQFYLVDFQVLPEAIKKTIRVKEMLKNGTKKSINEAVLSMNMSRSAYYKYKDHVEPAYDAPKERVLAFFMVVQNDFALFNRIIRKISREDNEVLTISKSIALGKFVPVTISFKTKSSSAEIQLLKESIQKIKGVKSIETAEEEI